MVLRTGTFTSEGKRRSRRSRILRAPTRFLAFSRYDGSFNLYWQLIGIPMGRRARSVSPSNPHSS